MDTPSVRRAGYRLDEALWTCKTHFVAAGVFSAFINILYLAPTIYMLQIYDRVITSGSVTTLYLISLIFVSSIISLCGLDWLRSRLLIRCGAQLDVSLAAPIFSEILSQPGLSRIERTRFVRDFDVFRQAIAGYGALAAFDAPWIPIYVGAAFLLHPALGALCVCACGTMIGLAWLNEKVSGTRISEANSVSATVHAKQDYASSWAEEIRALGMVDSLVARQLDDRSNAIAKQIDANFAAGDISAVIKFTRLLLQSLALGLAALLAVNGHLSPGALMGGSFLLARCLAPVEQIVGAWKGIVGGRNAYHSLRKLLGDGSGPAARTVLPRPSGAISVENLVVVSPIGNRVSLAEVTFALSPGELVAVSGPSGAGKSTLLRTLAGATTPARGYVRLDGAAIKDWGPAQYAQHVGYMPQEFALFPGTIKENISKFRDAAGADPRETDQLTVAAARLIGAHEMILRLADGYDTVVGLGGIGLSGGQTQRIALARAMFGSPAVLILDEPDAHLDLEGESALASALQKLRGDGVTIIAAGHRGRISGIADKILVLNSGQVQAFGSLTSFATSMRRQTDAEMTAPLQPLAQRA